MTTYDKVYRKYLHLNYKVYEVNILVMLNKKRKIVYRILKFTVSRPTTLTGRSIAETYRKILNIGDNKV